MAAIFFLQNSALRDMGLVHCVICATGILVCTGSGDSPSVNEAIINDMGK